MFKLIMWFDKALDNPETLGGVSARLKCIFRRVVPLAKIVHVHPSSEPAFSGDRECLSGNPIDQTILMQRHGDWLNNTWRKRARLDRRHLRSINIRGWQTPLDYFSNRYLAGCAPQSPLTRRLILELVAAKRRSHYLLSECHSDCD